ncbi:MAG: hypothetical protein AMXMBFR44_5270 [Candidatus Campbellbacteria bacterium]
MLRIRFSRATIIWAGVAVLAVVGIAMLFRNGNGNYEEALVERRDLVEEVILSGTVEARIVADLGFEVSGAIREINVTENAVVPRGATLASLGLGTLSAELQSAQAEVAIKRAETANTQISLDNAWSELLSDDLVAKPQSSSYTQTAPIITGRYSGDTGTYKFRIKAQAQPTEFDLVVFDLENPEPVEIEKTGPTPLGTKGLYVTFPDALATYRDTTWYVTLPNTEGTSYAANYSVYKEAESDLRAQQSGTSIAEAQLQKAEADVARIRAQIAQRVLSAPFAGVVTAVHADPGEAVSVNTPVISLISNDGFGVEVDLPEIDSVKVKIGDPVTITLDAFGEETTFAGTVASVNRAETLVDNVSVYEARIAFDERSDSRIASGMTAQVSITTDKKEGVLAVPVRAVKYREDGTTYVSVMDPETEEPTEKDVVVGLRSSDSFFEIISGLSEGERVLISL